MEVQARTFTAFRGSQRIAEGGIRDVALATKECLDRGEDALLVFDDETGQQIDLDLRGTPEEALERLKEHPWLRERLVEDEKRTGPGRPKLGVISREVSLLPRHWEWLGEQPGGASASLRKLVEERMKASQGKDRARRAQEAAYKFAWIMGGNLPQYEEASRALTRKEYERLDALIADWPADIRDHLRKLAERAALADREAEQVG